MTAVLEILGQIWPFLLAAAGVVFGMFRHQQAKSTEAAANQKVAEAETRAAQANEAGAQAGADNAKVRRDEDADAAGMPDANRVLHDEWSK